MFFLNGACPLKKFKMVTIFFKMAAIFLESLNLFFSNGDAIMTFGTNVLQ